MLKKFLIWLITNLIVLLLVSFIFSAVTIGFPSLARGLFGDLFEYASPEMQKQTIGKLAESCSSLGQENAVTMNQVCSNRSLLDSMRENCQSYRALKQQNMEIDNEEQIKETCRQIESGELESACGGIGKNFLLPDFSNIGALCKDYKSGKINDKEFFFNVLSSPFSGQQERKIGVLEKYNSLMHYLNENKAAYFVILAVLVMALYSLVRDNALLLIVLSRILLNLGILITLPYFAILAYDKLVGIDTTPILGSMFGAGNGLEPKAVLSVILLLFLRTYNVFIITIGIVFLASGIVIKTYEKMSFEKPKKTKSKDVDKLFDELEESVKKEK